MIFFPMFRLALIAAGATLAMGTAAFAQSATDADKPVTPPDSYRVVMENERMRMIEVHIRAHSKVDVDSPTNRERFLYMLTDGALILAPPGKKPYEFALHAGETAVFPAVSPTVENDTDAPVRALMVEVKEPDRALVVGRQRGRLAARRGGRGKLAVRQGSRPKAAKAVATRTKSGAKPTRVVKSARPKTVVKGPRASAKPKTAARGPKPPLDLSKANARPSKKKISRATNG
jgi:hypothetical protein